MLDYFAGSISLLSRDNAWQWYLKKRLLIAILHMSSCLVSIHREMWIQQQTLCSHQRLSLPRVVLVLRWVLFVRIFVSPHYEFEQHMYSSDLRTDILSRLWIWIAVELSHRFHSPHSKPQPGHLIPQLDSREVKNHSRLRHYEHRFFFSFLFYDSRPGSC